MGFWFFCVSTKQCGDVLKSVGEVVGAEEEEEEEEEEVRSICGV